jgi:hypothetical protein
MKSRRSAWLPFLLVLLYVQVNVGGDFLHQIFHWLSEQPVSCHEVDISCLHPKAGWNTSGQVDSGKEPCVFLKLLNAGRRADHRPAVAWMIPNAEEWISLSEAFVSQRVPSLEIHPLARPRGPPASPFV